MTKEVENLLRERRLSTKAPPWTLNLLLMKSLKPDGTNEETGINVLYAVDVSVNLSAVVFLRRAGGIVFFR